MRGYETDPEAPQGLKLVDELPEPDPAPDEVLIEVRAFSINRGELMLVKSRTDGWHPGQDVAGQVAAVGADVTAFAVGDRVVGVADGGGWSERVAVPSAYVAALPDEVSFEDASTLPIAGLTALRALRQGGDLLGRHVLVTGATGAVGQIAIQLAVAAGATVTAQVSGPEREQEARDLGAHTVVTDVAGSGPFHLACDGIGGAVLTAIAGELEPGGTVVCYGASGGPAQLGLGDFGGAPNSTVMFLFHHIPEEEKGADIATLVALTARGAVRAPVGRTSDWSEAPASLAALADRQIRGKAVCTLS